MGKAGQTYSVSLTGVLAPQLSRKFRRRGPMTRGDPKQRLTIFGTRVPTYTTALSMFHPHRNQIFSEGGRRGACRSSTGLDHASQQSVQVAVQKKDVRTSAFFSRSQTHGVHFNQQIFKMAVYQNRWPGAARK